MLSARSPRERRQRERGALGPMEGIAKPKALVGPGPGHLPPGCPDWLPWLCWEVLGIPETKLVVPALAIGYQDLDAPVNRFSRPRVSLEELANWKGIEPQNESCLSPTI